MQVFFVVGIGIGSFLSNFLTSNPLPLNESINPQQGFVGGFLGLVGSRLAMGGLGSHGIGGTALLSTKSCIAFVVIFVAGSITTVLGFGV